MKEPPPKEARAVHRKLSALAAAGINGEAYNAKAKLARLESRFDFSIPEPEEGNDLFAGIKITFTEGDFRRLMEFPESESDVASFVAWAFQNRFGVKVIRRYGGQVETLWIECSDPDLPRLQHIATIIRKSFGDLWGEFSKVPGAETRARKAFLVGLYDGMMNDERAQGQKLPPLYVPPIKRKSKPGRKAVSFSPGLSIHPYTVAIDLGRKIRLSTPIGEIVEALNDRILQA